MANRKKEKEYVVEAVRVRSVLDFAVTALQKKKNSPEQDKRPSGKEDRPFFFTSSSSKARPTY